jgi:hypothetical protein
MKISKTIYLPNNEKSEKEEYTIEDLRSLYKDELNRKQMLSNEEVKPKEEWKPWKAYPIVEVSNSGNIKINGKKIKPEPSAVPGYFKLGLGIYLHQLVALVWLTPDEKYPVDENGKSKHVHHINNKESDNSVENLIFVTCAEHGKIEQNLGGCLMQIKKIIYWPNDAVEEGKDQEESCDTNIDTLKEQFRHGSIISRTEKEYFKIYKDLQVGHLGTVIYRGKDTSSSDKAYNHVAEAYLTSNWQTPVDKNENKHVHHIVGNTDNSVYNLIYLTEKEHCMVHNDCVKCKKKNGSCGFENQGKNNV